MAGDYRRFVGRSVLLQLDDHSIGGILDREVGQTLVLTGATLVEGDGKPVEMDGEIVIERFRILWAQAA